MWYLHDYHCHVMLLKNCNIYNMRHISEKFIKLCTVYNKTDINFIWDLTNFFFSVLTFLYLVLKRLYLHNTRVCVSVFYDNHTTQHSVYEFNMIYNRGEVFFKSDSQEKINSSIHKKWQHLWYKIIVC